MAGTVVTEAGGAAGAGATGTAATTRGRKARNRANASRRIHTPGTGTGDNMLDTKVVTWSLVSSLIHNALSKRGRGADHA